MSPLPQGVWYILIGWLYASPFLGHSTLQHCFSYILPGDLHIAKVFLQCHCEKNLHIPLD